MTSTQKSFVLISTLLVWFQSRPPQSTGGGIRHSALAQNLSAAPLPNAANQGLTPEVSKAPKRDFVILDATVYLQKPDLTRYGLRPVSMVYQYMLWPAAPDGLPGRDMVSKAAVQSKSTGIAVLDIEHWPLTGDPAVVEESIRKYQTVIQWFKEAAPSVKVGYYGVAPTQNYWDAVQPIHSPKYIGWQKSNDGVASIAKLADIIFPSIYTFYEDQDGWSKFAAGQILEARRFRGGKPVYAFLWPQYHDSNKKLKGTYVAPEYWRMELETVRKYADGAVIWGGYKETWDETAPWWVETKKFLRSIGSGGR